MYVLLFECYSDRSEWKQGLAAVTEALGCVPPDYQVITHVRTRMANMLRISVGRGGGPKGLHQEAMLYGSPPKY